MSSLISEFEPPQLRACTVSHGIEDFEILIEDLEQSMSGEWGDLRFDEALPFLDQPDAAGLEVLIFAVDEDDVDDMDSVGHVLETLRMRQVPLVLVTDGLNAEQLRDLMRRGGDEFVAYPPAPGALNAAIDRLRENGVSAAQPESVAPAATPAPAAPAPAAPASAAPVADDAAHVAAAPAAVMAQETPEPAQSPLGGLRSKLKGSGTTAEPASLTGGASSGNVHLPATSPSRGPGPSRVIAVQGLAGGSGASTLAANLAHELATADKHRRVSVCLMDFDFQFGTIALLRDMGQKAAVVDLLSDTESVDEDSLRGALQRGPDGVDVLTAPEDLIPLDFVNSEDVARLIQSTSQLYDFVVIDMPRTIVDWTETVLTHSDLFLAVLQLDVASAQNVMRFRRALQAEEIPTESLRYVLNRAPRRTDLTLRSRMQSMAQSLGITFELQLPEAYAVATAAADQGEPLSKAAPKSPLRKAIAAYAAQIVHAQASAAA